MGYFKSNWTSIKPDSAFHVRMMSILYPHINRLTALQYKEEQLINESCQLNSIQQIWLLYYMVFLIYLDLVDREEYYSINGGNATWTDISANYDVATAIKVAKCLDIDFMRDIIYEVFVYSKTDDSIYVVDDRWILATGTWDDTGIWINDALWQTV